MTDIVRYAAVVDEAARVGKERLSFVGQRKRARRARKEAHAQFALQTFELARDIGFGDAEFARRGGEMAGFDDLQKYEGVGKNNHWSQDRSNRTQIA